MIKIKSTVPLFNLEDFKSMSGIFIGFTSVLVGCLSRVSKTISVGCFRSEKYSCNMNAGTAHSRDTFFKNVSKIQNPNQRHFLSTD